MMIVSMYVPYPVEAEVFLGFCPELGIEYGLVFLRKNLNPPKLLTFSKFSTKLDTVVKSCMQFWLIAKIIKLGFQKSQKSLN